jgi:hypothetical protein
MSTTVVPAPVSSAKRPANGNTPKKQVKQQPVDESEVRLAESEAAIAEKDEVENTSIESESALGEFTFGAALADAAASSSLLATEAEGSDKVGFGQFGDGDGSTVLLVGAIALVALGVVVLVADGGGKKNQAPTVSAATQAVTTNEDTPATVTVSASDPDGDALTFTVTANPTKGTVTGGTNGIFTYSPSLNANGSDTFTVTVRDPAGLSVTQTVNVTITAVNDAPVNTLPAGYTTAAGTAVKLSGLSVADVDAGSGVITVALAVASGTLTATSGGNVTVTGSGTASVVLSGTLANINAYLGDAAKQPSFLPAPGSSGSVQLTMTTNDGGNTGSGGPKTDIDTINVTITGPATATINVTAAGANTDSDAINTTYNVALGNYTYTITGFDAGPGTPPTTAADKIVAPVAVGLASLIQDSFSDGIAKLQFASSGNVVLIVLDGLTATQDAALFGPNDLNTVFGAGAITFA